MYLQSVLETIITMHANPQTVYKKQLRQLLQVTRAINSNYSRNEILDIYVNILKGESYISRFVLFSVEGQQLKVEAMSGVAEEVMEFLSDEDVLDYIKNPSKVYFKPKTDKNPFNIILPAHHKDHVLSILMVETVYDNSEYLNLPEHIADAPEFLQTLHNIVFVALENKKLFKENLQQERLRKELELASELQAMLFPPAWPANHLNIDIAAFHIPFSEVGGDYFDYFIISEKELALCIADVSGKGISAALLMSNFQANVRALFPIYDDLKKLLNQLAENVDRASRGERFITGFFAIYNIESRMLTYINAGHNPPVLRNGDKTRLLEEGTTGLGMISPLPFVHSESIYLEPGSVLVCYTDGVSELENSRNEYFGYEPIEKILQSHSQSNSEQINLALSVAMSRFKGSAFHDDAAILTCKFD